MAIFSMKDYNDLVKDVRKANQRIQKLQGRYGESSWAINQLYDKIDNENINGVSVLTGNIKVNKNMSDIQLKAIQKATSIFLESQTSTLRGVKVAIKNMEDALQAHYSKYDNENPKILSSRDAELLYKLVENKETRNIVEKIGASETWTRAIRAKDEQLSKDEFVNLFENTKANLKDPKVIKDLETIYKKYMV